MSMWSLSVLRKNHSKEIIAAKIMKDTSTKCIILKGCDLYEAANQVENLTIQNQKVYLTNYEKANKKYKNPLSYYSTSDKHAQLIKESFIIVIY